MENAKEEFIREVKGKGKIVCARVGLDVDNYGESINWSILKDNYSKEAYEKFVNSLDFEYDSGYGSQELFGIILFENSFSNRHEYDGSEYWCNQKMPTINNVIMVKE